MPLHWDSWHKTLHSFGVYCQQSYLEKFAGIPSQVIIPDINHMFGSNLDHDLFVERKEEILYPLLKKSKPIAPVVAVVHAHYGKIPMAVVSGGTRRNILASLDAVGITHMFQTIVSADDPVSPKPSPDVFLEAARRLQAAPEHCQVFEDADSGVTAGLAAGMIVTDVRRYLSA